MDIDGQTINKQIVHPINKCDNLLQMKKMKNKSFLVIVMVIFLLMTSCFCFSILILREVNSPGETDIVNYLVMLNSIIGYFFNIVAFQLGMIPGEKQNKRLHQKIENSQFLTPINSVDNSQGSPNIYT